MHRARSILAALAAVALSATAVFAAAGMGPADAANGGLEKAAAAAGKTVPTRVDALNPAATPDATESSEPTESPDVRELAAPEKVGTSDTTHPANHGALVSAAAQGTTPAGFANHGAYVRSIAQQNQGQKQNPGHGTAPVTRTLPTPTPTAH